MRLSKPKARRSKLDRGFTLIELLIVIGVIGFLAAAVLVAVDPVKRIQDSRDSRRYSETNAILNAILNRQVDERAIYNGASDAPIITSPTYSQVIVSDDTGIECDTVSAGLTENFPGCNQTLDNTARAIAGTLTASASTTLSGSGSDFLTSVRVGDTIVIASSGLQPCIVKAITDDNTLTCTGAVTYGGVAGVARSKKCVADLSDTINGIGTLANSGTAVTGNGTVFLTQVKAGDTIISVGQLRTVVAVLTDTTLTTDTAFSPALNGSATYTVTSRNPLLPNYIASAPIDPRGSGSTICATGCATNAVGVTTLGAANTGYYIHRSSGNRVEIGACKGEQTDPISVKR